jgi:NTE family protein
MEEKPALGDELASRPHGPAHAARLALAPALRRRLVIDWFEAGATMVRQGEPAARLFLIASGTVRVLLGRGDGQQIVARLGAGAWVGETALLTGAVSSTTVVAETLVQALTISQEDFLAAAESDPAIFREIARELAHRLRSSNRLLDQRLPSRVVLLSYEREHVPEAAQVLDACRRWAREPLLCIAGGAASAGGLSVNDYLAEPERLSALEQQVKAGITASVSIDDGGGGLAGFLERAREFAPLIVVASSMARQETLAQIDEVASLGAAWPSELELDAPRETWPIEGFDAGRVARSICRQRIGLALGGGAARGYAHVGVLKVLQEAGVPFDVLAGTSVGAPIAASLAAGLPLSEIGEGVGAAGRRSVVPHFFPMHSIFTNTFLESEMKHRIGKRRFEELALPLGVVAVDLDTAEEIVFSSGELIPALLASMALPGIFPPVRHAGRLLVDGGVRAPVPVQACRDLGADIVVSSRMRVKREEGESEQRSRSTQLLPDIISRALDIMQDQISEQNVAGAEVAIETEIPREQAGLFDFSHRSEVEAAGELAARSGLQHMFECIPALGRARAA